MKKLTWLCLLTLLLTLVSGCRRQDIHSSTFFLMDTAITVTLYTENVSLAEEILAESHRLLSEYDAIWSRTKEDSDVSKWNRSQDGSIPLDERTLTVLQKALAVGHLTDGAFDVTVAPLVALWNTCGLENRLPSTDELERHLALVDCEAVYLNDGKLTKPSPDVQIDLGGIGKGAAIEALIGYLQDFAVDGGLVSFGSNVAVFGEKPNGSDFRVALRDPKDTARCVGTLSLYAGEILSVSGDYERYVTIDGARYHHLLDPDTGYPADTGLASVAVIASDGAVADALSTALFVMGYEEALAFYESGEYVFEAIFVDHSGTITTTAGLSDRFMRE